jgi:hypothetical protein
VAQAIGTTELSIMLLGFFEVIVVEANMCSTSAASFIDFILCDIVFR